MLLLTKRGIGRGGPTWTQPAVLRFTAWGRSWSRCGAVFQSEKVFLGVVSRLRWDTVFIVDPQKHNGGAEL